MRRRRINRGRWQVERERHRIPSTAPAPEFVESVSVDEVLPGLLKRLGIEQRHWEIALSEEWDRIVGDVVAAHTSPGRLAQGVLTVFVDSAVWLDQLKRYSRREVLSKIQERFGRDKIRDVRFAPDPG